MTSITIDSFRRSEKILHALADASTAEMATNLAGLFIEASAAKPDLITWRSLADRYGQSGEALQDMLNGADATARTSLGFSLFARGGRTYFTESDELMITADEDPETTGIALSKEFTDILTGASAPRLWTKREMPELKLDASSSASIALPRDAAQEGGAPFLYRQTESEDPLRHLEVTALAAALAEGDNIPIYVAATAASRPGETCWTADPPVASLLSAVLHLPDQS
jgi:hypothetical protein